jgi:hypothetical protein
VNPTVRGTGEPSAARALRRKARVATWYAPAQTLDPSPQAPSTKRRFSWPLALVLIVGGSVCCFSGVGVMAAISIPAFAKYVKRAKTAEATTHLRELGTLTVNHCEEHDALPPPMGPVPDRPASEGKMRIDFDAVPAFAALGFGGERDVYYRYQLETVRDGVVRWVAVGDLDQDGYASRYELTCTRSPCSCDDDVVVHDALE